MRGQRTKKGFGILAVDGPDAIAWRGQFCMTIQKGREGRKRGGGGTLKEIYLRLETKFKPQDSVS